MSALFLMRSCTERGSVDEGFLGSREDSAAECAPGQHPTARGVTELGVPRNDACSWRIDRIEARAPANNSQRTGKRSKRDA
jgi:hypothetical protein